MSTLPPLVESSASARARLLLRAARTDGPRPGAAGRTLTALGVVGTTAKVALAAGAVAPAAGITAGAGSSSLAMIASKWMLVGTLGGGALASSAAFVFSEPQPVPAATAPSAVAAPPTNAIPAPAASSAREHDLVRAPPPNSVGSAARKPPSAATPSGSSANSEPDTAPLAAPSQAAFESPEQSKLLHDLALLDDARRALRAGNASQAKAALERYEHERLTHVLDREAQVMRDRLRALLEDAK